MTPPHFAQVQAVIAKVPLSSSTVRPCSTHDSVMTVPARDLILPLQKVECD